MFVLKKKNPKSLLRLSVFSKNYPAYRFTNYLYKFFYHLPPFVDNFYLIKVAWTTYPPLLVNVVCERPLRLCLNLFPFTNAIWNSVVQYSTNSKRVKHWIYIPKLSRTKVILHNFKHLKVVFIPNCFYVCWHELAAKLQIKLESQIMWKKYPTLF